MIVVGFLQRNKRMKLQWYKRLICYVFIAILFASGMQVEIDSSHSFFACESNTTTEESQYNNTHSSIFSDYCTYEQLQSRNAQHIRNNSVRKNIIRRIRSFSPTSTLCTIKQNLFYLEVQHISHLLCSTSSQIVIIKYMHQQDGAK